MIDACALDVEDLQWRPTGKMKQFIGVNPKIICQQDTVPQPLDLLGILGDIASFQTNGKAHCLRP
jgi:hypothetical protein